MSLAFDELRISGNLRIRERVVLSAKPAEIRELIPRDEWCPVEDISQYGSVVGIDILLIDDADSCLAFATILQADSGYLDKELGCAKEDLVSATFLTRIYVKDNLEQERYLLLLLYAALRHSRVWKRPQIVSILADGQSDLKKQLAMSLANQVPAINLSGAGGYSLYAGRLDRALYLTDRSAFASGLTIEPTFLVSEIKKTLEDFFEQSSQTRWFRAIAEGTLTKEQYVYSLSNFHQFVRFSTRLLGLCVTYSNDTNLRAHFAKHLIGEVNHELIIEKDLAALGEDVDYVKTSMAPNLATREFMAMQESLIGFHRDSILMMAGPLAAEGIARHLDQKFVTDLHNTIATWDVGVEPSHVTGFYVSHLEFDGGDHGHWENSITILEKYLTTEARLASFISCIHLATDALLRCFNSYVDDLSLLSAQRRSPIKSLKY